MMDWKIVREEIQNSGEPIDAEILPLVDVLNETGFETICSCCGHGGDWPIIWFINVSDERVENLERFLIKNSFNDWHLGKVENNFASGLYYYPRMRKEILEEGYWWELDLILWGVFGDTPLKEKYDLAIEAINHVVKQIKKFVEIEKGDKFLAL